MQFTILCFLSATVVACSGMNNHKINDRKYETAYFERVDLKRFPVRVFDEINPSAIESYKGSYFKAEFNEKGLIVCLKLMDRKKVHWKARYEYSDEGELRKEIWEEGDVLRTRWFSPEGSVIKEVIETKREETPER